MTVVYQGVRMGLRKLSKLTGVARGTLEYRVRTGIVGDGLFSPAREWKRDLKAAEEELLQAPQVERDRVSAVRRSREQAKRARLRAEIDQLRSAT